MKNSGYVLIKRSSHNFVNIPKFICDIKTENT